MDSSGGSTKKRRIMSNYREPAMDVSLPDAEWFDEINGPSTFLDLAHSETEYGSKKKRAEKPIRNSKWNASAAEVVELSDEDDDDEISSVMQAQASKNKTQIENLDEFEEITEDDINITTTNTIHSNVITNDTITIGIGKSIQTPDELRKIILNRSQLEHMAEHLSPEYFHRIAIGSYVCVNVPGLPEKYKDLNFIDRIEKVLEPQTYQHLWLDRRFRLCTLGDIGTEQIVENSIQDDDNHLRHWFYYMEAKGELLPTQEFIRKKEKELLKANLELQKIQKQKNNNEITEIHIKRENLEQIALNPSMLRKLAKLDFEFFQKTVINCFVCMPAIRKNTPDSCQYHIVRVIGCIRGQRPYKVRNIAEIDYQLDIRFYGKYIVNWIKEFPTITDDGFSQWIEDMKLWKDPIPTQEEIQNKAAELQLALNEAEKIQSLQEKKKYLKDEEERMKKSKLPVQSAKDLKLCLLSRQQLQKLSNLDDINLLSDTICGCFVRLKVGSTGKQFQIDQIVNVDVRDEKPIIENDESNIVDNTKEDNKIVVLKYTGTITYSTLITAASAFIFTEQEFRDWLRKMHNDLIHPLPTYNFLETKSQKIKKALETATEKESKENTQKEQKIGDNNQKSTNDGQKTENNDRNRIALHKDQSKRVIKKNTFNRPKAQTSYNSQPLRRLFSIEQSVNYFNAPPIEKPVNYFGTSHLPTKNNNISWRNTRRTILSTPGMELRQIQTNSGPESVQRNSKIIDSLRIDDWRLCQREDILRNELLNIPGIFPPTETVSIDSVSTTNTIANRSRSNPSVIPSLFQRPSSQLVSYGLEPINFVRSEIEFHPTRNNNNRSTGMFFNVPQSNNESSNNNLHARQPMLSQSDYGGTNRMLSNGSRITSLNSDYDGGRSSLNQFASSYPFRERSPQPPPVFRFY